MTFRSFSRFVRWYRWPVRWVVLSTPAVLFAREHEGRPAGFLAVGVCLFVFLPLVVTTFLRATERALDALERAEDRAIDAELDRQERLRAMPLRGWTK